VVPELFGSQKVAQKWKSDVGNINSFVYIVHCSVNLLCFVCFVGNLGLQ